MNVIDDATWSSAVKAETQRRGASERVLVGRLHLLGLSSSRNPADDRSSPRSSLDGEDVSNPKNSSEGAKNRLGDA